MGKKNIWHVDFERIITEFQHFKNCQHLFEHVKSDASDTVRADRKYVEENL